MLPAGQMKHGWPQISIGLMFSAQYFLTIPYNISHEARRGFEMQQLITIEYIQRSCGGFASSQSSTLLSD
jgi:hypothetical protein